MNPNADINWNLLAPNIIELIATYSQYTCLLRLRLLNRRWKSFIDPFIFQQLPDYVGKHDNFIIEKYGQYFTNFNFYLNNVTTSNFILSNCPNLSKICITDINRNNMNYSDILDIYKGSIKYFKYNLLCDQTCEHDFTQFNDKVGQLNRLEALEIIIDRYPCQSFPVFDKWRNIKQLVLYLEPGMGDHFLKSIEKLENLTDLEWRINIGNTRAAELQTNVATDPSAILNRVSLKRFKFSITSFQNPFNNLREYTIQQFEKLLLHSKLNQLQSLESVYEFFDNRLFNIFKQPLPNPIQPSAQLTSLHLKSVDKYLMDYIIKYFPNLTKLHYQSPLVLPYCDDCLQLPPMVHLNILSCKNVENNANNNPLIIRHLFPNVTKLYFERSVEEDNRSAFESEFVPYEGVSNNSGILNLQDLLYRRDKPICIPEAFPNIEFMAIDYDTNYIQELIDDLELELGWEQLYIRWNRQYDEIYEQLFPKLSNLKYVYLDKQWNTDFNLKIIPKHVKVFIASEFDELSFDIKLVKELQ